MIWVALGLALSTLVSEDAATLGAGVLARNGELSVLVAVAAAAVGIWTGDVGLFLAGRLARRWAPVARWVARRWPEEELHAMTRRLERGAPAAILLSRMLPGSRVALYVAAGLVRVRATVFVVSTAAAVAIWTSAIVVGVTWTR